MVGMLASGLALAQPEDAPVASSALDAGVSLIPPPVFEPPQPRVLKPRQNLLLPILESEALHFILAASNNLLLREHFAQLSWDSTLSHFDGRRPWEADVDQFVINQVGHPVQGALSFTAARSSGINFWVSTIYPFMSSLTWELFFEIDAPSWNDQVTTPIGGIFLGEVMHRTSLLVLHSDAPEWLRVLGAFLLNPMGQLNRVMLDGELDAQDVEGMPHVFAMVGGGVNLGTAFRDPNTLEIIRSFSPQANVQARITYGLPGDPAFKYDAPFSHFDLDVNVSFPGVPVSAFFMRGLLAGRQFGSGSTRGVWGVFGQYDFSAASLVRISSVGFGLGTSLQAVLPANLTLQLSGVISGVPMALAGSLGLEEGVYRDYHIGPGGQATLEARLIWNDRFWIRVVGRTWFTAGLYIGAEGWESITYLTAGPLVRIWGPIALGADVVAAVRRAKFDDDTFDRSVTGATARFTLNWVSSETLGAVRR